MPRGPRNSRDTTVHPSKISSTRDMLMNKLAQRQSLPEKPSFPDVETDSIDNNPDLFYEIDEHGHAIPMDIIQDSVLEKDEILDAVLKSQGLSKESLTPDSSSSSRAQQNLYSPNPVAPPDVNPIYEEIPDVYEDMSKGIDNPTYENTENPYMKMHPSREPEYAEIGDVPSPPTQTSSSMQENVYANAPPPPQISEEQNASLYANLGPQSEDHTYESIEELSTQQAAAYALYDTPNPLANQTTPEGVYENVILKDDLKAQTTPIYDTPMPSANQNTFAEILKNSGADIDKESMSMDSKDQATDSPTAPGAVGTGQAQQSEMHQGM